MTVDELLTIPALWDKDNEVISIHRYTAAVFDYMPFVERYTLGPIALCDTPTANGR